MNLNACRLLLMLLLVAATASAQTALPHRYYEVLPDSAEGKLLRGIVTIKDIVQDSSFSKWYTTNGQYFKPKPDVVKAIQEKAGQLQYVLFLGTWCHDTQQLLPVYLKSFEAAALPDSALTLIAADRMKTTIAHLHQVFQVPNVPTLIIMKGGKEVGRIEEYGQTSLVDTELAALLRRLQ